MASNSADAAETDEQRFLRELRRLLAKPDDIEVQSEGQEQQKRQQQLDDDPSIEATRNLLRACQEAQGVGLRTVTVLESQGEQLDNVERALDELSSDLDSAEEHLSKMRRPLFWFCPWRCRWKKKKQQQQQRKQGEGETNKNNNKAKNNPGPKLRVDGTKSSSKETAGSSKSSSRSSTAASEPERLPAAGRHQDSVSLGPQKQQRSQHPDDQLGAALTDLKGVAQEMGQQLSTQNEQIDRLTVSATSSEERLRRDSQRAGDILRDA